LSILSNSFCPNVVWFDLAIIADNAILHSFLTDFTHQAKAQAVTQVLRAMCVT
jgi:hypothetical protein